MAGHEESAIVPEGHRVTTTSPSSFPEVVTSIGTARVAHLGVRGDEQGPEVEALFDRVQRELETPAGPVLLCAEIRTLSDLFAPSNPKIQSIPALVVWTGRQGCFGGLIESAEGVQHLLRLFHAITNSPQPRAQVLYLTDMNWPNAQSVTARLKGLGIDVRKPHPAGTVMVEIDRPEGVVLTTLLGESLRIETDTRSLAFNREKDDALRRADTAALSEIERRERAELEKSLAFGTRPAETGFGMPGKPVLRCGRLRTLVLEAIARCDAESVVELARALLANPYSLLAVTDAQGRRFLPMQWNGGISALPVHMDIVSLELTANTLKLTNVGYAFAEFSIAKLCQYALQSGARLAINAYASAGEPRYLLLTPVTVHALAAGRAPTVEELAREKAEQCHR
jgi:hypothetical protein